MTASLYDSARRAAGYALAVRELNYERYSMRLDEYEEPEVAVPMTHSSYVRYALSETSIELALGRGVAEADIRAWCAETLASIFDESPRDVFFDAYLAYVRREN
jgi:hypothetical protein